MKTDKNVVFQAMDKTVKIIGSSGDYYLNNYPLVSEFKEIMQRNFIESQIEFLNNFLKAKGEAALLLVRATFPWTASPFSTVAPLQVERIRLSVPLRPLPSWVQNGMIVFPLQSWASRNV